MPYFLTFNSEECQTRMVALKERNEKETQSFQQEIKELERQLEQDRKLKEFLIIKTAERSDFVDNVRKHLHSKLHIINSSIYLLIIAAPIVKGSQELLVEKMDNYEMAFENIKQLTKCNDINDLVKRFSQIEDENFSLFNYVNEINNQFEAINNEISQIQRQIDDLKSANAEEEGAHNKRIAEFEQKLKATEALTDQYNKQYEISAQSLESIRKFVGNLADVLKLPPVESDSTVSKVPVSKQLASIEQKINEMLMKNLLLALPKKFITAAMPPAGSGANATAAQGNKEGQSEANADKPQAQSDATKDPVALAALLQTLIDSGELSQSEGDTLHGLLGQGPNAPVTSLAVRAPNTV